MGEGLQRAKRAAEQTRGKYPSWICADCGRKHGYVRILVQTYHDGDSCGWCNEEKATTEPRDWGYPPSPKEIRKGKGKSRA